MEPNGVVEEKVEPHPVSLQAARHVDEDAARLELGYEFREAAGAQPLFVSEVSHLLALQVADNKDPEYDSNLNPVMKKSLAYAKRFGQLETTEQAIAVREQLTKVHPPLHPFEIAQLASLMPRESEEAKAIIPSLAEKYEDDKLNDILKNMNAWL